MTADTRPRYTYILPDGVEVQVIHDHGETPPRETTLKHTMHGEVVQAWLKLDGTTVTNDEIIELLDSQSPATGNCAYACKIALGELRGGRMGSSKAEEYQARARCAEIINARRAQVKP